MKYIDMLLNFKTVNLILIDRIEISSFPIVLKFTRYITSSSLSFFSSAVCIMEISVCLLGNLCKNLLYYCFRAFIF